MNGKSISPGMIAAAVLQMTLFIAGLGSILCKPLPLSSKWKWIPLLFVNTIGPIIYFAVGSKSLNKKVVMLQETSDCENCN